MSSHGACQQSDRADAGDQQPYPGLQPGGLRDGPRRHRLQALRRLELASEISNEQATVPREAIGDNLLPFVG